MPEHHDGAQGPSRLEALLAIALALMVVQAAWLAAHADPTPAHRAQVVLHLAGGLVLAVLVAGWGIRARQALRSRTDAMTRLFSGLGPGLLVVAALIGVVIAVVPAARSHRWVLNAHVLVAVLAAWMLGRVIVSRAREAGPRAMRLALAGFFAMGLACAIALAPKLMPPPQPPTSPAGSEGQPATPPTND